MCTDPTNQVSSSKDTEQFWQDALCVLNGFQWPFQVQVYSETPSPLGGKIPARTIRLSPEGLDLLREKYKVPGYTITDTLFVPEQCIVPSVSLMASPAGFIDQKDEFGETYGVFGSANVHDTSVVLWAPPAGSSHYKLEFITCRLHFVGCTKKDPSKPYAFISTKTSLYTHSFRDNYLSRKCPEGGYMYRAPLNQIYRCETVNQVCTHVSQHLHQAHLEFRQLKIDYSNHYEFFYKIPESLEIIQNVNSSAVQELDKAVATLDPWLEPTKTQAPLHNYLKEGEPLTRGKITAGTEDAKDLHDNCQKQMDVRVNAGKSSATFTKTTEPSHEDWLASYSKDDSKGNDKMHSSSIKNKEPHKIILFGNCFIYGEKYTKVQVDGIKEGDLVVASLNDHDDILGKVVHVSDLVSIKPKQIFVGVRFEEPINMEPFEVRHVRGAGDQSTCVRNCNGNFRVFIPVEILLNPENYTGSVLRLLKSSEEKTKARRKSLCVSDIHIDYSFEANCRDFVANSIECVNPEKLSNMGIEGNANSCYIDAVLFALYAFTTNFDEGLCQPMRDDKQLDPDDMRMKIKAARNVLKYDILTPLRSSLKVKWENVYKLRIALSEIFGDKSYLGNFMDSEAFISSLFSRVLQVPEFFTFDEDTKDYILQLFPPLLDEGGNGGENKIKCSGVQHLLQEYCGWNGVKLQQVPNSGFLIKLPVSNGVPYYQYVYPNLNLHLGKKLLQKKDKSAKSVDLGLRAVICLKKSHFTCFVRMKAAEGENATWYFHDSMATENGSTILTECPNLEKAVTMVASRFDIVGADHADESEMPAEAISWLDTLLTTAYICVYEPLYEETYI